jgi:hypothetical protein
VGGVDCIQDKDQCGLLLNMSIHLGSMIGGKLLDQMRDCSLLKNDCTSVVIFLIT